MKRRNKSRKDNPKKIQKGIHKPLFKGEKPLEHAKKENKARIKSLRSLGKKKATALANKLENCCSKDRCNSPACAVCNWFKRRNHTKQMKRIFRSSKYEFHVTIVPVDQYYKPKELRKIKTKNLKDSLRKRMERAGINDALVVGSIEVEYKFKRKLMCLHWHLIFGNCSKEDIEKLRHKYPNQRQMKKKQIKPGEENKTYQYTLKNSTFGKDPSTRKPKRPEDKVQAEHLYFLDRHRFQDLMFRRGVTLNGKKLGIIDKSLLKQKILGKNRRF